MTAVLRAVARYPVIDEDASRALLEARAQLEAEAPRGADPDPYEARHHSA